MLNASNLRESVHDAKHFSVLVRGATLQYYYWLIKSRQAYQLDVPDASGDASCRQQPGAGSNHLSDMPTNRQLG